MKMKRITLKEGYHRYEFKVPQKGFTLFLAQLIEFSESDNVEFIVEKIEVVEEVQDFIVTKGDDLTEVLAEIGETPLTSFGEGLEAVEEGS